MQQSLLVIALSAVGLLHVNPAQALPQYDATSVQLDFSNTVILGANVTAPYSVTYNNVMTGVDAKLTFVSFSGTGTGTSPAAGTVPPRLLWMDKVSTPTTNIIDTQFDNYQIGAGAGTQTASFNNNRIGTLMTSRIDFYQSGSNFTIPVEVKGFTAVVGDIDSLQAISFKGATSANTLASSTSKIGVQATSTEIKVSSLENLDSAITDQINWAQWNYALPVSSVEYVFYSGYTGANGFQIKFASAGWAPANVLTFSAPSTAVDDSFTTAYQSALSANVSYNDRGVSGSSVYAKATDPSHGTVVFNPDGTYVYTPNAGWSGVDTFTYNVTTNGVTSSATETITTAPNGNSAGATLAVNDSYTTAFNTALSGAAATGDIYPIGSVFAQTSQPSHGTVSWNNNGTYTYTPTTGYSGTDSFTYSVTSGGVISTATETITIQAQVTQQNTTPTVLAVNDSYSTSLNTPVSGVAGTGDTAPSGSVFAQTSQPAHGTVAWNADGTYVYTPNTGYTGTDTFTYSVTSGGVTSSASETITISAATSGNSTPATSGNSSPAQLVHTGINGASTMFTSGGALAAVSVGLLLVAWSIMRRRVS